MIDRPGFHYTVTDQQLAEFQKWSLEERLEWVWQQMKFLRAIQSRDERIRTYRAKGGKNLKYYEARFS
jgi:hypothetical protein